MAPVQKRAITDHFFAVPRTPKEEEKKQVKMFPLFLKKPATPPTEPAVERPKNTTVTQPEPTIPIIISKKKQEIPDIVYKKTKFHLHNPLQDIIKADTQKFFQTQKRNRQQQQQQVEQDDEQVDSESINSIEEIENYMNEHYPDWQKEPSCQYLIKNIPTFQRQTAMPWCDKYRPNHVEGFLGQLTDLQYIKQWLEALKIGAPLAKAELKKKTKKAKAEVFNLLLFVGPNGSGKTSAAYTVAKETGYNVFEINSTCKRSGKDVLHKIGEMTESHLVRFDLHQPGKKRTGETIIMQDTIKKKKFDITSHFKKMVTVSPPAQQQLQEKIKTVDENKQDIPMEEQISKKNEPTQSLVLLEEVDVLFEEDKGFWNAVIDLCQKSKRPIIMTCNDTSQIPFDSLSIESTIYFEPPDKSSLLPYLQLICLAQGHPTPPIEIDFLSQLYHHDTRKLIDILQLWSSANNSFLFSKIMGFYDLICQEHSTVVDLMDRLQGQDIKAIELCIDYYLQSRESQEEKVMGMTCITKMMETASFADAYITLTSKQRHQIYDIDQYNSVDDKIMSNEVMIYKDPKCLDHWELGDTISNRIFSLSVCSHWHNYLSAWSDHWEDLCYSGKDSLDQCMHIVCPLVNYVSSTVLMTEYMPAIRSLIMYDQGIAGKGRTKRTRKKIPYIQLDEQSRNAIIWQQL